MHITILFGYRGVQNVFLCTFDFIDFSVCTSTPGPWVADPHSTFRDNDQGCGHSDAATCFPIPQRHGRPICRAGHAVYQLLIFSIFAYLATVAVLDRKVQTGSNMAQNRHGWPFCRLVLRELIAGHHIVLGGALKKGVQFLCQQAADFL